MEFIKSYGLAVEHSAHDRKVVGWSHPMLDGSGVKAMPGSIPAPNPGSFNNWKRKKIQVAKWGTPKKNLTIANLLQFLPLCFSSLNWFRHLSAFASKPFENPCALKWKQVDNVDTTVSGLLNLNLNQTRLEKFWRL